MAHPPVSLLLSRYPLAHVDVRGHLKPEAKIAISRLDPFHAGLLSHNRSSMLDALLRREGVPPPQPRRHTLCQRAGGPGEADFWFNLSTRDAVRRDFSPTTGDMTHPGGAALRPTRRNANEPAGLTMRASDGRGMRLGDIRAVPLQILLQLVQKSPVRALGDDLLRARLDHPGTWTSNCGVILKGTPLETVGCQIFEEVIAVASG